MLQELACNELPYAPGPDDDRVLDVGEPTTAKGASGDPPEGEGDEGDCPEDAQLERIGMRPPAEGGREYEQPAPDGQELEDGD